MTAVVFILFFIIIVIYAIFTMVLFYHVGRYSFIGDVSKRVFAFYVGASAIMIAVALILLILNHILSSNAIS
jgi:hypothetical protein